MPQIKPDIKLRQPSSSLYMDHHYCFFFAASTGAAPVSET
jgi:hypothetical protein